jgi:AraC-like DNA-binding protein
VERLGEGEENISGLAFELGFSSHSHLTRVFRRAYGVVPSQARGQPGGRHFGCATSISSSRFSTERVTPLRT